jgi:hypothetical protein
MLLCVSSWAQSNILGGASPKLKKFLSDKPQAAKIFTNAISSAFSNRTVQLFYFYSEDDSTPWAYHFYPNQAGSPEVMLCVRENQTPLDEFITTLFEIENSKNEDNFTKISQDAYYGTISREQFAKDVLQYEFEATKDTRAILLALKLGKKETGNSYYYPRFLECPTNFDGFLSYSKNASTNRDVMKEYELKYDRVRKMYFDSNASSNSIAPKN